MNAFNQNTNDITTSNNADFTEQPLLILDALDLAAVGGGADVVVG
jgi:hypothetical protein